MTAGPRLTDQQRRAAFGAPCTEQQLITVDLWGQRVRAHQLVATQLIRTCQLAHEILVHRGIGHEVPLRVDSYNCRPIRSQDPPEVRAAVSMHAYGLAWDLFRTPPSIPPPGGVWTPTAKLPKALVDVFELAGFTWGGRWARRDEPHFEWAAPPPLPAP